MNQISFVTTLKRICVGFSSFSSSTAVSGEEPTYLHDTFGSPVVLRQGGTYLPRPVVDKWTAHFIKFLCALVPPCHTLMAYATRIAMLALTEEMVRSACLERQQMLGCSLDHLEFKQTSTL